MLSVGHILINLSAAIHIAHILSFTMAIHNMLYKLASGDFTNKNKWRYTGNM
jgi:hypothetical protein